MLEQVHNTHEIMSDYFICSKSFQDLWNEYIIADYELDKRFIFKVGRDVLKNALIKTLGGNTDCILGDESFRMMQSFWPVEEEPLTKFKFVKLIDLINFTDFIDLTRIVSLF